MRLLQIPLTEIEIPERYRSDYGDIEGLKCSIREHGIIQPIAVTPTEYGYRLLAGGRRMRACTELGMDSVPARIYERSLGELDEKAIELSENLDRKDFDWKERIRLEQRIHELQVAIHGEKWSTKADATGWSQRDTAKLLGKSPATITRDLQIAEQLDKMPELAACKNKDEAEKVMKKKEEALVKMELARRIISEQSTGAEDIKRRKLIDSYIVKDFFTGIKDVPNGIISLCDCDPPYGIDFDKRARGLSAARHSYGADTYHEVDKKDYEEFLGSVLHELYRVMAPHSWLLLWFGIERWAEVAFQLIKKNGFKANRVAGLWYKEASRCHTSQPHVILASAYDAFYYCRKGEPAIIKQGHPNVFTCPNTFERIHPTEKPVELMTDIFSTFALPSSPILVPFLGSGNSLLAAANYNCPAFGYDLSEENKNAFSIRTFAQPYGAYHSF